MPGRDRAVRRGSWSAAAARVLDSVVFDDGWDDNRTLWGFTPGFPAASRRLRRRRRSATAPWACGCRPGAATARPRPNGSRYGATQGFETNRPGFSLAGPKYYARFREVCLDMIRKYKVNYFKFDGIAQGIYVAGAGGEFAADVDGLLRLVADLRRARPDVFVNITTGTWPSPYLAVLGRFGVAQRRRHGLLRPGLPAPAVDHLSRHDHVPAGSSAGRRCIRSIR